ncbi:MAG: hypothetical protein E7403_00985 [Ruminococcaceae bacterium]|nr:hypothetical protein [Oscillospiraceae bacterium]
MAYTVNFLDNELVTAEYLNQVAEDLGGHTLQFSDEMTYGVDDLNGIAQSLVTKGVSNGCALSTSSGKVHIGEGILYMRDGRKVMVDEEGVTLDLPEKKEAYVWFEHDVLTGFVIPRCTEEKPLDEDYVLLGQITAEGTIVGRSDRAVMKNPFLGLHGSETVIKQFCWDGVLEEKLLWEIELEDSGYQHVVVYTSGIDKDGYVYNACCGHIELSGGTAFSVVSTITYGANSERGFTYSSENGEILAGYPVLTSAGNYHHFVYLRFVLGDDGILRVYQRAKAGQMGYNTTPAVDLYITVC